METTEEIDVSSNILPCLESDIETLFSTIPDVKQRYKILVTAIESNQRVFRFFQKRRLFRLLLNTTKDYAFGELCSNEFRNVLSDVLYRLSTRSKDYNPNDLSVNDVQQLITDIKSFVKKYNK